MYKVDKLLRHVIFNPIQAGVDYVVVIGQKVGPSEAIGSV